MHLNWQLIMTDFLGAFIGGLLFYGAIACVVNVITRRSRTSETRLKIYLAVSGLLIFILALGDDFGIYTLSHFPPAIAVYYIYGTLMRRVAARKVNSPPSP